MSEGGVDRFQLQERIASGGTAQVYRALDTATGNIVAVKIVESIVATDHARFARETSVVAQLDHPNVVRYIAHGLTPRGELFLAMELVAGATLRERLHQDPIGIRDAVLLAIHLADALVHVHQAALVHRDIKPSNILGIDTDFRRAKLADFGIVLPIGSLQRITRAGAVVGTLRYMSPEQVNGHPLDYRSDLYSLGCVLFECILRRPAHPEPTPSRVRQSIIYEQPPNIASLTENVPSELAALIAQLLHKHPYRRPDTAAEVRDRLAAMTDVPNEPARLGRVGFAQDLNGSFVKLLGTPLSTRERRFESSERRSESSQPLDDTRSWLSPFERRVTYCMIARSASFNSDATTGALGDDGRACLELLTTSGLQAAAFADGYMTAVSRLRSSPADETEMLASAALRLRDAHRGVSIAIIAGAGLLQDGIPATTALEGARRLLEAAGRPGAIYLDIEAAHLLEDRFAIDGETMPFVLGERRLGKLAPRAGPCAPFVGRTRELGRLIGLTETAIATRSCQSIAVTGDIGLGKTRLLCELLDALEDTSTGAVFTARSHPPYMDAPLLTLADLALRALAAEAPNNPMRMDGTLFDVLQPWAQTTLGRAGVAPERDAAIAQLASNMLFDWLLTQSRTQPVVLLFDDAQWMGAMTFDWLRRLARTAQGVPLIIVRFANDELEPLVDAEATLGLRPLDDVATRTLVRDLCGPDTPDDVAERVAGNPFFAAQLAAFGVDQLPAAVLGVVQASLDRASAEARRILRAAAVVGFCFDRAAIEPLVSDLDRREIDLRLRELTELGVISVDGSAFWFRNAILRAAASAMLIEADRQLSDSFRSS